MGILLLVSFNWWMVNGWLLALGGLALVLTIGLGTCNYLIISALLATQFYISDLVQSSPERVAVAFQKAFLAKDFETAKQLATEESHELLNLLAQFQSSMPNEINGRDLRNSELANRAECQWTPPDLIVRCRVCCTEEGIAFTDPLLVAKVGSKWHVKFTKETTPNQ